jgi:hypothetical protein
MGIQQAPTTPPTGQNSTISSINASITVVTIITNLNRLGGLIENKANKNLYCKFGDPAVAPVLTAGGDFLLVPSGGNIDIPEDFTGPIGLIWTSGFAAGGKAVVTEIIP